MNAETEIKAADDSVVFDGQCPFCRAYVASLQDNNGDNKTGLNKVDARRAPERVAQLAAKGIDVNSGIVLIKGETVIQGAEALSLLAREHGVRGYWGGLHHRLLRYRCVSRLVYPLLRTLRNTYLRLARRSPIETGMGKG